MKKEKLIDLMLCLGVLAAMLLFFERAHPLVILDADDWTYISQSRVALPVPSFWNPARILPELLMPWSAGLGVLLFGSRPYIAAITLMNGLVLSLFITGYVYAFFRLLTDRLALQRGRAALLAALFLLLHFTIFRTEDAGNGYLFHTRDVTCVYYYVIPGLLNCTLVMQLARTGLHRRLWERRELGAKTLLLLAAYLAVFSNLFESAILACWCGVELLTALLRARKDGFRLRAFLQEQSFSLLLILSWLASIAFEGMGGRSDLHEALPMLPALAQSLRGTLAFFRGVYWMPALLAAAVFLALALLRPAKGRMAERALLLGLLGMGALLLVFEILLCARVEPGYVQRSDVMFGCCFALLALTMLGLGLLLVRYERLTLLLGLLGLLLFSVTNTRQRSFLDCNDLMAPAELCTALDELVIEQVLAAEAGGEQKALVRVPDYGGDNWPQTLYMGDRVAASLYKHGVIQRPMEIEILPDPMLNERFHVLE